MLWYLDLELSEFSRHAAMQLETIHNKLLVCLCAMTCLRILAILVSNSFFFRSLHLHNLFLVQLDGHGGFHSVKHLL